MSKPQNPSLNRYRCTSLALHHKKVKDLKKSEGKSEMEGKSKWKSHLTRVRQHIHCLFHSKRLRLSQMSLRIQSKHDIHHASLQILTARNQLKCVGH